ncbi:hypothetical protein [Conchiformibius steedae]|uniref:Uncharacterized protein n=1 Tax=Conchiformibius steedae TaxID=153493 RepID=A0A3P2A8V4_9NEIS|nr:hypothetical protein [Conchiformibius steedae]RRD91226.1 hypothetical protein EII21_02215 [Conchiformibius steedae]
MQQRIKITIQRSQLDTSQPEPPLRTAASVRAAVYSALLMLVSFFLPVLVEENGVPIASGIDIIKAMWVFVFIPIVGWTPFANLFYWMAWLMLFAGKHTLVKVLLGLTWLVAVLGTVMYIVLIKWQWSHLGIGALLWFLSFAALTLGVCYPRISVKQMWWRLAWLTLPPVAAFYVWWRYGGM